MASSLNLLFYLVCVRLSLSPDRGLSAWGLRMICLHVPEAGDRICHTAGALCWLNE